MLTELQFEDQLIKQLTEGESQWTLRDDIRTEEQLWQNIREKINYNNIDKLEGIPLTDMEFEQVKNQLSFSSFYDAGKWLVGENGSAKVEIHREDTTLGRVHLEVINQRHIAGGNSSYEVIHQLKVDKRLGMKRDRRLDVTLLFNGLPLIHLELKNAYTSRREGFNQINKYIQEEVFTGPLSMIQMFVIMNERGAEYIAAPRRDKELNAKFLTGWLDENNQLIKNGMEFAKEVLSIPQAHRMIAEYTVLDEQAEALILLRPYQIQAIKKVQEASFVGESGYVWHTTGSGKTLTSYKVARNLLKIASVDKTIFLVDRKDLDNQTFNAFNAYSENDLLDVDGTDHTQDLIQRLLSGDRSVIVTTRQKLDNIMKYVEEGKLSEKKTNALRQRKIAFVVDECHRTISAEKQREIKRFFRESMWYGFTGTPIFEENKKQTKGNLAATTEEQYGVCLHKYTVKEAIHDKAVLGFKMDYQTTLSEEEMIYVVENSGVEVDTNQPIEVEKAIPKAYFETDEHKLQVIDAIINHSLKQFGMHSKYKKNGQYYEAILTTSSIKEAQRYYELFQEVKEGKSTIKISNHVRRFAPDFPKVAITYSVTENEDNSKKNQEKMEKALADYNAMFGTHFDLGTIGAYNSNLNERLARKKSQYLERENQLDIVIVVDRLLTGFDAPCISTLFIDRAPQKPQDLIQAFSRTNRIFDETKSYGNIKTFRTPHLFKEAVDHALRLYSSGGENHVLAPTWEETDRRLKETIHELLQFTPKPEIANHLELEREKRQYARLFQKMNTALENAAVYDEFDEEKFVETYHITKKQIEAYQMAYLTVMEELSLIDPDDDGGDDNLVVDLEYTLSSVRQDEINYDYIINLLQSLVEANNTLNIIDARTQKEVDEFIYDLQKRKPKIAHFIQEIWDVIQKDPYQYANQNLRQLLEEKVSGKEMDYIEEFANKWYLSPEEVKEAIVYYDPDSKKSSTELKSLADEASKQYKAHNDDGRTSLKLKREFKSEFTSLVEQQIRELY